MSDNLERSPGNGTSQRALPDLQATGQPRRSRQVLLTAVLTLILGLAAYLRLAGLGDESFWLDEGYTVAFTGLPFRKMMAYIATRDVHPPLYYILIKFWRNLGDSEVILASPFRRIRRRRGGLHVVPGGGTLGGRCRRRVLASPRHIRGGDLVFAGSQDVQPPASAHRPVSPVFPQVRLAFPVCRRGRTRQFPPHVPPLRDCVGLTVFTLALLYTHNVAIFLWGAQLFAGGLLGLVPLVRSRRRRSGGDSANPAFRQSAFRQWIVCQAVIGVLLPALASGPVRPERQRALPVLGSNGRTWTRCGRSSDSCLRVGGYGMSPSYGTPQSSSS